MKTLIAALEQLRASLLLAITHLERGDKASAKAVIDQAHEQFDATVEELKAAA